VSSLRVVQLVTWREIRERGLTRGYLIGTALTLIVVVSAIVVPTLLVGDGPDERTLGLVGEAPEGLGQELDALLGDEVTTTVTVLPDRDAAVTAIEDDEVDLALVERRELLREGTGSEDVRAALDAILQREAIEAGIAELGVDPAEAAAALTPPPPIEAIDLRDVDDVHSPEGGAFLVAIGLTVLLFLGIQLNGASVLSGALEEKSSRVVEVLVSVARPWQLLAGKLLGMSVLAIVQIGSIVGAALAANAIVDAFDVPPTTGTLVAVSLVMLVAGFLFYASLYAVAGSLASSLEDAQSSAAPLGFLLTGAYFAVFIVVLPDPTSTWSSVLSFVPPTAPFVVPARLGLEAMPPWQAGVAIAVTVVAAFVTVRLAGRLYASSLLAGGKLSWREAWRGEPVR
jgi:ABC-2 type transport system permease protein